MDKDVAIWAPCVICGDNTDMCCADCGIDSGGENIPHICFKTACRDEHEKRSHDGK